MISNVLLSQIPTLKFISRASPDVARAVVSKSDCDLISGIIEICLNVLAGNISCTPEELRALKSFKTQIKKLARTKKLTKKASREKKLINQRGGSLLPILIDPALKTLKNILSRDHDRQ